MVLKRGSNVQYNTTLVQNDTQSHLPTALELESIPQF